MQRFLEKDIARQKDYDALQDAGLISSAVMDIGFDFMCFADSFYDNDGNYTDDGVSNDGLQVLIRYSKKYKYEHID